MLFRFYINFILFDNRLFFLNRLFPDLRYFTVDIEWDVVIWGKSDLGLFVDGFGLRDGGEFVLSGECIRVSVVVKSFFFDNNLPLGLGLYLLLHK